MKRIIDEKGFEYIERTESRDTRQEVEPVRVGDRPSVALLEAMEDKTWILLGRQTYRRDLDAWIVGRVHPDESMRYNTVETSWIVETHSRDALYRLDPVA